MRGRDWVGVGFLVAALLPAPVEAASSASVTVDGAQTYQVIEGFGANINHRSWNNDELLQVFDALLDEAGLTLFRVIFDNADWEDPNDDSNASVMNWSYYNGVYTSTDFQKLWDMSAYLNQRGITNGLILNFQGTGPSWMLSGTYLTPGYEAEWAEMIASLLVYARNTQHLQFSMVGPGNEEDIPVQGIDMTPSQYTSALHKLSQLLDTNGMSDVRFIGPDLASTKTAWLSAMMTDPLVMGKVAHFGLHSYEDNGSGSAGIDSFLKQSAYPDRTFWMTEYNTWCTSCQAQVSGDDTWGYARGAASRLLYHLANGAAAALVWEACDGEYYYFSPPNLWSYWGLFAVDDTEASPRTYTPRKTFYTITQTTKFVRPGARQIDVSGSFGPLLLLAFYHPDSAQLTLTGINTNAGPATLTAALDNLPPITSLELYYTDSTTDLRHSTSVPVSDGSFTTTIPGDCVFTLVGVDPASLAVSVAFTNPADGAYYAAPATIPIQAIAATTTGSVSRVEFYSDTTSLGGADAPPYDLVWSNVPPGNYILLARATNSLGNSRVSAGVHVTVVGPLAQLEITPTDASVVPYGSQQFTATAADVIGTPLNPQPVVSWEVSGSGTIDSTGLFIAGGDPGGPFDIAAICNGVTNWATVSVSTNVNLAPAGTGYTWNSMTSATDDSPQAVAPGINDGDTDTDVSLFGSEGEDISNAYEAAGVIWSEPQSINRVVYHNGSYDAYHDGVFTAAFRLQFSPDGNTWTNAGPAWTVTPAYTYNSAASANASFTFAGGVATVGGVRCLGRVHTTESSLNSWVAFATELEAFAAPIQPTGPTISAQSTNQAVPVGATAVFNVTASGIPRPTYQWLFNGTNLDAAVAATLSLTNVQLEQAGSYSVVVTNVAGSATSAVAELTVLVLAPVITHEPTNLTALAGAAVDLSVAASGTAPLSYQWLFNGTNLDGALAEVLSLTNVQPEQAGSYCVVVTNVAGSVTSASGTLTVLTPPVITAQPTNQMALVGTTASFEVTASGTVPLGYQWRFNGTNIDGAIAETLSMTNVQPDQAGSYNVVVTNAAGTVTGMGATLTVVHYPVLRDARMITNGTFTFALSGDAGCNYVIDVSTNLSDWAPFGTVSNEAGEVNFTDSACADSSSRFYRARLTY